MYDFQRSTVGAFTLHASHPGVGQEHHKKFGRGVTPDNQWTLNVYISGAFEIEIPSIGYRREMLPGHCSLDIELPSFPPELCIERCLNEGSYRICISPTAPGTRWSRTVLDMQGGGAFVAPKDHVLVLMQGNIDVDGAAMAPGDALQLGDGALLRWDTPARGVLMTTL